MRWLATTVLWIGMALLTGYFLTTTWASDPTVDKMTSQIRHPDVAQRIAAIQNLGTQKTLPAFKTLLLAAYDSNERVRIELERALTGFNDPIVVDWIRTVGIRFPDKWVRFYSIHALLQGQGPKAMPDAIVTLEKNYPEVQVYLLDRLTRPGMSAVLADEGKLAIAASVLSPRFQSRLWLRAISLLEQTQTPAAVEQLVRALEPSQDWPPRALVSMVHASLARMKGAGLTDRAKDLLSQVKSPAAKIGAMLVLGSSGESAALATLQEFLKGEKDPDLRAGAIAAIGRHPGGTQALIDVVVAPGSPAEAMLAASALLDRPAGAAHEPLKTIASAADTDFRLRGLLTDLLRRTDEAGFEDPPLSAEDSRALRRAVAWLVRNQEEDGHWDGAKHNPHHGAHGFPKLWPDAADDHLDVQSTAWALLALMADRNNLRTGPYAESVRRGMVWLLAQQRPNGMIKSAKDLKPPPGGSPDFPVQVQNIWALNHLTATLALLEASFLHGQERRLASGSKATPEELNIDKAVESAIAAIGDKPLSGEFDWFHPKSVNMPRVALLAAIRFSYAKRTQMLGLAAGGVAKDMNSMVVKFIMETLNKIAESATTIKVPFDRNDNYWFRSYASSAQAISAAVYLTPKVVGTTPIHEFIGLRMNLLREHPPRWNPFYAIVGPTSHPPATEPTAEDAANPSVYTALGLTGDAWKDDIVNFEYWCWATNSCFIVGEDDWFMWKDAILPVLHAYQSVAGATYGSYEPDGPTERVGGRVLSTAQAAFMWAMPRRTLNIHNVTWTRVVPPGGFAAGKQATKSAADKKKAEDEKKAADAKKADHPKGGEPAKAGAGAYGCPMHPEITSAEPGKCSKCGMALTERK